MPECANCDSWVSSDYARVYSRRGRESTDCCPHCPDLIRDDAGQPREARGARRVTDGGAEQ
jgi:hypothetical protein